MNNAQPLELIQHIDLNLFRVFDVVMEERNLTRAAKRLAVSQSAISHALNRLREQVGDPLFERSGRGVDPTPLAERMAPDVRDALDALTRGVQRSRSFDPTTDLGRVVVCMPDVVEPLLLLQIHRALPDVPIVSARLRRDTLEADLAARRVDLAIDVPRRTSLHQQPLLSDRLCVLSTSSKPISARAYRNARHVAVSSRPYGDTFEDLALRGVGVQRHIAVRCQTYGAAARIIAEAREETRPILLSMAERQAGATASLSALRRHPFPFSLPPFSLQLYWHPRYDDDERLTWLRRKVMALAEDIPLT